MRKRILLDQSTIIFWQKWPNLSRAASRNFIVLRRFSEAESIFDSNICVIGPIWVGVYCTSLSLFSFIFCVCNVCLGASLTLSQTVGSLLRIQMALSVPFHPMKPSQLPPFPRLIRPSLPQKLFFA